jgi:hypothetical protein
MVKNCSSLAAQHSPAHIECRLPVGWELWLHRLGHVRRPTSAQTHQRNANWCSKTKTKTVQCNKLARGEDNNFLLLTLFFFYDIRSVLVGISRHRFKHIQILKTVQKSFIPMKLYILP